MSALDLSLLDGSPVSIEAARVDAVRALPRAVLPAALDAAALVRVGGRWIAVRLDTSGGKTAEVARAELAGRIEAAASTVSPLWEWNGEDLSQFTTGKTYRTDTGQAAAGSAALSVVPAPAYLPGENAIRATATDLVGGVMFLVPGFEAPAEYEVEYLAVSRSGVSSLFSHVGLAMTAEGGELVGLGASTQDNASTSIGAWRVVSGAARFANSFTGGTAVAMTDAAVADGTSGGGGVRHVFRVRRPAGESPAAWRVRRVSQGLSAVAVQTGAGGNMPGLVDWAGLDAPRIGVGIYCWSTPSSGAFDIARLRVWPAGRAPLMG